MSHRERETDRQMQTEKERDIRPNAVGLAMNSYIFYTV